MSRLYARARWSPVDRAADALGRHRLAGAESLRELADAQLLEQPWDLGQGAAALAPALVGLLELVDRAHAVAVDGGVVGQALQATRRCAQVAKDVGQPRGAGGGDEPRVHEAPELAGDVLARF